MRAIGNGNSIKLDIYEFLARKTVGTFWWPKIVGNRKFGENEGASCYFDIIRRKIRFIPTRKFRHITPSRGATKIPTCPSATGRFFKNIHF